MFRKKTIDPESLQGQIDAVLAKMNELEPGAAAYTTCADQLEKLYKMKDLDRSRRLKADTIVNALVNLTGIGLILGSERAHVVSSKALSFIVKPKL